jgi:hypothetical protein
VKSIRIAIYASIAIHFLRMSARKLSPGHPRDSLRRNSSGPWQVAVTPPGHRPIKVANCRGLDTANGLVDTIDSMCTHNGYSAFAYRPKPGLTREERMVLEYCPIILISGLYDNSPDPNRMYNIVTQACAKFHDTHGYR